MDKSGDPIDDRELAEHEVEQVLVRTGVRPKVVHEAIRREGELELRRSPGALAWSAVAAGLSMGFSLVGEALLRVHLPEREWTPLVAHLGYTLGFLFVIGARQQLFTEDTLLAIIPLFTRRDRHTLGLVARLWAVVLVGNVVGALLFATAVAHLPIFDEATRGQMGRVAAEALAGTPAVTFARAIFAGWIIALMVWIMPAAEHGRVIVIIIMSYVVAVGSLSHVIAGTAETLFAVVSGQHGALAWLLRWFLPTLAGNIVGGVALVSALNHAQVVTGENSRTNGHQPS